MYIRTMIKAESTLKLVVEKRPTGVSVISVIRVVGAVCIHKTSS